MKYKLNYKIFSIILCLVLIFCLSTDAFALSLDKDMLVRVGLVYSDDSSPNYNVFYENGYYFGYYDSSNTFVSVYTSNLRFISVADDYNYAYSSQTNTLTQGGSDVGAFHCELSSTFTTQKAAQAKIDSLSIPGSFIAYSNGIYKIRTGNYSTLALAANAVKTLASKYGVTATAVGNEANTFTVVDMNTGNIAFEFCPTQTSTFAVRGIQSGTAKTKMKNGTTYYYGDFEFFKNATGKLNLINVLPMQDYLKGVLPYEMSNSWPIEALKAQAVAARNYVYANMTKHKSDGFMVCDCTHCQMYGGTTYENANVAKAVDDTYGMVLTYNGRLVEAYYHASSGGYTENVENVWFTAIPYLVAVKSDYEDLPNANYGIWHYEITPQQLLTQLQSVGYDISSVSDFYISKYTAVGNVLEVTIVDNSGKKYTISKETIRVKLSPYIKSQHFLVSKGQSLYIKSDTSSADIAPNFSNSYVIDGTGQAKKFTIGIGDVKVRSSSGVSGVPSSKGGVFVIDGKGYGNNVGMSQEGAKGMAKAGFTFDQILTHYYTGTKIENLS